MRSNQHESIHNTALIIQNIVIQSTKVSRGGALAEYRNQIPHEFPMPSPPPTYDRGEHYFVHRIDFGEHNQFQEPLCQKVKAPSIDELFETANCSVEGNIEVPVIKFQWRDGAPTRTTAKSIIVPEKRWLRVEYNCRFSDRYSGDWYYEHEIINVAQANPENPNVFLETKPYAFHQQLAHLW